MNMEQKKLKVGILGATGMVGQRFITLLENHPWFEIEVLAASKNSAGGKYKDIMSSRWMMEDEIPERISDMAIYDVLDMENISKKVDFVFSAVDMPKEEIVKFEEAYAKCGIPVISNNSACRFIEDVPMIIPEINFEHAKVIESQRKRLGTETGFIAVKPNCSIQSYVPLLAAWQKYLPYEVVVSTYQAISGAGKTLDTWPEMKENIIPFIKGEEEKSELEPLKVLGELEDGKIKLSSNVRITCQCIRVPVLYGHTATVFIRFKKSVTKEELIESIKEFRNVPKELELPSATSEFIRYIPDEDRPQVIKDVWFEGGMGVSVGRLREDKIYDFKFVALSHNTIRGAAGGGILVAELYTRHGYIKKLKK